ncbi:hypothetical protein [Lysinibacillus fusiformis]|uniref:hypothetical protein n=1 Tax=Lysinibacillus fusiformis TaxID=28031 RepID=UPI00381E5EBE
MANIGLYLSIFASLLTIINVIWNFKMQHQINSTKIKGDRNISNAGENSINNTGDNNSINK